MTTAIHNNNIRKQIARGVAHAHRARTTMQAEQPERITYINEGNGQYGVPEIVYPDGMPAYIIRDSYRRVWYAERNPGQTHYTRAAAAHAEYQRARTLHRRAEELQLTAKKIRDAAEDYAQSNTEYRHAHAPYVAAIYAQSADLTERRGIANYWHEVRHKEGELLEEMIEIAGIHADRVHRVMLLAEARYVQQHYPEDYKQIEAKAATWRKGE